MEAINYVDTAVFPSTYVDENELEESLTSVLSPAWDTKLVIKTIALAAITLIGAFMLGISIASFFCGPFFVAVPIALKIFSVAFAATITTLAAAALGISIQSENTHAMERRTALDAYEDLLQDCADYLSEVEDLRVAASTISHGRSRHTI